MTIQRMGFLSSGLFNDLGATPEEANGAVPGSRSIHGIRRSILAGAAARL